ncbi:phytochelatin synthetase [Schizosaccharomyces japonicus yFS275]|uniref:glutathione gamma-glutamylcysteinyltransferase n=1 Tax=Schizosaccharomyces japonicus (strain yFS275 / FY16936) TaxID=402676 RepID=B6K713_SCHJY|nr:phytochelatin synthetase [Schizosaccharomyces japonicus yFS275]EEB09317.1 phytochelatin synthetase [Schizosaccharomyces japonicus yFS275]
MKASKLVSSGLQALKTRIAPTMTKMTSNPLPSAAVNSVPRTFYKRQLPSQCTAFDSTEGKRLFMQALQEGGMENYFSLAQQFVTQNEPAFCGLGTLCMILNSLKVDPGRLWKGAWRWYDQDMLDCCRSLSNIKKDGITIEEFSCLAACNGLSAQMKRADNVTLEDFRRDLVKCSTITDCIMAVSYSRKALGQTGDGHFSPVGGISFKDDKVLILDVARFKYPSYWVDSKLLYESLLPLDKTSGKPRGYVILRPLETPLGLLTFRLNKYSWRQMEQRLVQQLPRLSSVKELADLVAGFDKASLVPLIDERAESAPSAAFEQFVEKLARTKTYQLFTDAQVRNPLYTTLAFWAIYTQTSIQAWCSQPVLLELNEYLDEAFLPEFSEQMDTLRQQLASLTSCCTNEQGCCRSSCCNHAK